MDKQIIVRMKQLYRDVCKLLYRCVAMLLHIGPIPEHIAFIMDGNRRYAKQHRLEDGGGHKAGSIALSNMLKYCCGLRVKYITIYAFSIDNLKRRPEEIESTMQLIHDKVEGLTKEDSIVHQHGLKVNFIGNLDLLNEEIRFSAERAMKATAGNSNAVLSICLAYTSMDEIMNAVRKSCQERANEVCVDDIEKHMYMAMAPDPDIIIRSSGETRLSNFLLWQSGNSLLYSPNALWPKIGFRHLLWGIIEFQRNASYLKKKVKHKGC